MYQFSHIKIFSTNQYRNLILLDDPGRIRSQIVSVVYQIQRFDFDCNLVSGTWYPDSDANDAKTNNT